MLAARAVQTCLLIIGGWDRFVDNEEIVVLTGTIHMTLTFHPLTVFFIFSADVLTPS
jgi:DUF1365 family protein